MIKLIVENLSITGEKFSGEEPAEALLLSNDEPFQISAPIKYDFTASLAAGDVIVRGNAKVTLSGECGLCLETTEQEVSIDDICCYFESPGQGELDITENYLEEISINLPQNIKCVENCQGLCPNCGQNLNKAACSCEITEADDYEKSDIWGKLDNLKIDN